MEVRISLRSEFRKPWGYEKLASSLACSSSKRGKKVFRLNRSHVGCKKRWTVTDKFVRGRSFVCVYLIRCPDYCFNLVRILTVVLDVKERCDGRVTAGVNLLPLSRPIALSLTQRGPIFICSLTFQQWVSENFWLVVESVKSSYNQDVQTWVLGKWRKALSHACWSDKGTHSSNRSQKNK